MANRCNAVLCHTCGGMAASSSLLTYTCCLRAAAGYHLQLVLMREVPVAQPSPLMRRASMPASVRRFATDDVSNTCL